MAASRTSDLKQRIFEIIFEADTRAGKIFDIALLVLILLSVLLVMLDSVSFIYERFHGWLLLGEWGVTILFTIEYLVRLWVVRNSWKYARSFYGIVDLLSILPTFLSLLPFFGTTQYLATIRALRLLRIFRILKMAQYITESQVLMKGLKASRRKITVFLMAVVTVVLIIGSLMYVIEAEQNANFSSIPRSVYWAIVTVTTVGYGDISPVTPLGQLLSSMLMIIGYGVLAVPTGIVSVEMAQVAREVEEKLNTQVCSHCGASKHDNDANYCKYCGEVL